jgi:hypothetical protein
MYPFATGFQPWLGICGMGKGGFLRLLVKKTGCLVAASYKLDAGKEGDVRAGGIASICDRGL